MQNFILWGTIVNTGAVIVGALLGLLLRALFTRLAERRREAMDDEVPLRNTKADRLANTILQGLGLCVIAIGIGGALQINNALVMILSIVLGTLVGELVDLDKWINRLGSSIERRMKGKGGKVAEAFISATLVFCVGAMTVQGALESGLQGEHSIYYTKAVLDLVSSVIFAFSLGVGVLFSAVGLFSIQTVMTLIAFLAAGAIPQNITNEIMAVGSLLLITIGTNHIGITKFKVMNLIPSMFMPIALVPLFDLFM